MLVFNVIDNGLACYCGVSRVLIMADNRFCKNCIPKKCVVLLVFFFISSPEPKARRLAYSIPVVRRPSVVVRRPQFQT